MLIYAIHVTSLIVYLFIGVLGMPQIIGSFQHIKGRGIIMSLITIILWTVIIGGLAAIGIIKLHIKLLCIVISYGIALLMTLRQGLIDE